MKQVTLNIPDNKFDFFMEIIDRLGLVVEDENVDIPKWQQERTLKRAAELDNDPSLAIDFNLVLRDIEQKYGL